MQLFKNRNLNSVLLVTLSVIVGACFASAVIFVLYNPVGDGGATRAVTNLDQSEPTQSVQNGTTGDADEHDASLTRSVFVPTNIQSLDELSEYRSPFDRGIALRGMLSNANEQQIIDLLEESKSIAPSTRAQVQSVILQRLAQLKPRNALSRLEGLNDQHTGEFIESIFSEWSRLNLEEAVSHAVLMDENGKFSALSSILAERSDLSEEKRREVARRLGNEQYAINLIVQEKVSDSTLDPRDAWYELVNELQNDFLQSQTLIDIANAWVTKSGLDVLNQVSESITNTHIRSSVLDSVLTNVAQTDPEGAFEYALGLDTSGFNSLVSRVVEVWARSDPTAALAAIANIDKSGLRRQLEQSVISAWAFQKPHDVLVQLDQLPDHLQRPAITASVSAIARTDPSKAAEFVAGLEDGVSKTDSAFMLASIWSMKDPKSALAWILGEPSIEHIRPQLLSNILFRVADEDPQLAMDTALEQPIDEESQGLEVMVISALARTDIDKAVEFLARVREGQTQAASYAVVGAHYIRGGETQKALDLAKELPESNRTYYLKELLPQWASSDPQGLLSSIDQLPTDEIKSRAALALSVYDQWNNHLTEEELERVAGFLTKDDAENVTKGIISY